MGPAMPVAPVVAVTPVVPVPAAITTPILRMVITAAVVVAVPATAPFVADVTGRDDGSGRWNINWRRRRGGVGDSNTAKCGDGSKCRNEFHEYHLLQHPLEAMNPQRVRRITQV